MLNEPKSEITSDIPRKFSANFFSAKFEKCSEMFVWASNNNRIIFDLEIAQNSKRCSKGKKMLERRKIWSKGKKLLKYEKLQLMERANFKKLAVWDVLTTCSNLTSGKISRTLFLRHYIVEIFLYVKIVRQYGA